MKKFMQNLRCRLGFHDLVFVDRSDDWLQGGTYIYQCGHCGHVRETRPYMGGEW